MGGLLQAFFSRVVAISSTADTSECSVAPVNFLIFHTSACFLLSYLALPAFQHGRSALQAVISHLTPLTFKDPLSTPHAAVSYLMLPANSPGPATRESCPLFQVTAFEAEGKQAANPQKHTASAACG